MSTGTATTSPRVRQLLSLLFVVMLVMSGISLSRYSAIDRRLDVTVSENVLWAAAQNEIELARFSLVLSDLTQRPESANPNELEKRFDLLWSRISLYDQGVLARSIADRPDLRAVVSKVFDELKTIEPLLKRPYDIDQLRDSQLRLFGYSDQLRKLTTAALTADRADRDQIVLSHQSVKSELTLVLAGTFAIFAALFASLLYSARNLRRQREEAVSARNDASAAWRQLDAAIENINEGFIFYDPAGRLIRCNQKYKELYSLSAEKLVPGSTFEEVIRYGVSRGQYHGTADDPEGWIQKRLEKRKNIAEPFEQQLGDGRWLMISDRLTDDGGRVGIRTDITDLKKSVGALEAARENLRLQADSMAALAEENSNANAVISDAIESINEGFVLYDQNDEFVLCNSKYRSMFGAIGRELKPGLTFDSFIRKVFASHDLAISGSIDHEVRERTLRRRSNAQQSYIERMKDGRWLQVSNRPTMTGGVVTVLSDITILKERELALIEARNSLQAQAENMKQLMELAQAASQSKSDFLAMISHEIRTPMNAVLGLSNLLSETRLSKEQRTFVSGIEESGNHLLGLINDILDFSRLEAGKNDLEIGSVSLRDVISGASKMVSVLAHKKNLKVSVTFADDLPDRVMTDGAKLNQILINLLGNAVKFTQVGGVSVRVAMKEADTEHVSLLIDVSDTGTGIPDSIRKKLFQPFERGSTTDNNPVSGTGLGLAITHRLVQSLDGSIELLDCQDIGTTFRLNFRFKLGPDKPPIAATMQSGRISKFASKMRAMKILVAEDTLASQLVIKTMLEKRGHEVFAVDNGQLAVEAATDNDFDLALLDIQMPLLSGHEVAIAVRKLPGSRGTIPLVALSAQAFPADRLRSLEVGFDDHLAKPIRPLDLDEVLSKNYREGSAQHVQ
jgi:signal transduction histidine kinase/ActR/RegA family two-component response regulator